MNLDLGLTIGSQRRRPEQRSPVFAEAGDILREILYRPACAMTSSQTIIARLGSLLIQVTPGMLVHVLYCMSPRSTAQSRGAL